MKIPVVILSLLITAWGFSGALSFNNAGKCTHITTLWGSTDMTCDVGWYVSGWGTQVEYPHYITVAHTKDENAAGSAIKPPYSVKLSDNWMGAVTQTTRFGIPQDYDQFMKMHNDFRGPVNNKGILG